MLKASASHNSAGVSRWVQAIDSSSKRFIMIDKCLRMSHRTDRLLAVLVILLALLVVAQTTVVPRNQLLGTIGLLFGTLAIVYALVELVQSHELEG